MIRCRIIQWIIGWHLDGQQNLPPWARRHSATCPECRRFQQTQTQIASRLAATPPARITPPSPFLAARIQRAIAENDAPRNAWPARPLPALATLWAVSFAVLLVTGLTAYFHLSAGRQTVVVPRLTALPQPSPADVAIDHGEKLLAMGVDFEAPLKQEMQSLVKDAKTALHSVASNCLPDGVLIAWREP